MMTAAAYRQFLREQDINPHCLCCGLPETQEGRRTVETSYELQVGRGKGSWMTAIPHIKTRAKARQIKKTYQTDHPKARFRIMKNMQVQTETR